MATNSEIDDLLEDTIEREGGFVDHPNDRGGATKYGITQLTYDTWRRAHSLLPEPVANLKRPVAKMIYREWYVTPFMDIESPILLKFIVNAGIQHGVEDAAKFFQRALNTLIPTTRHLKVDGIIGPRTRSAYLSLPRSTRFSDILPVVIAIRCRHYATVLRRPSQRVFAAGWFNRVAGDLS